MAHVTVESGAPSIAEPILLDGLPGRGLIGKLVVDHVLDEFDMEYYAGVYCDGIPPVAAYRANDSAVRPPVQVFVDPGRDLLALVGDVPVSPSEAPGFADCLVDWFAEQSATPIFISGLPRTQEVEAGTRSRELYGLATGDGDALLDEAGIVPPRYAGHVTGPTGALLHRAAETDLDSVGLLAESNSEIPDFEAARLVIEHGIVPITGLDLDVEPFVDQSVGMSPAIETFVERVREAGDGATRAEPTATFH